MDEPLDNRAIGVVYDPRTEHYGNYVPSIVPRRYDALLFIDETHALDPLHMPVHMADEVPETYPTGM
jgi:erythromycin esterase-like protein